MSNTPDNERKAAASVDDMAATIARQLKDSRSEREMLRAERETIGERLKWLDGEIDKAERMTKALIPRHRRTARSTVEEI